MNPLRLATKEEIEAIKGQADLDFGTSVIAMDGSHGTDFAVLRSCHEIDPLIISDKTPDQRKALFVWAIENCLRFTGVPFYYFNVDAKDDTWIKNVEGWGGKKTTAEPNFRFKKIL